MYKFQNIDPTKLDLIDYLHNNERNEYSYRDIRTIEEYDKMLKVCTTIDNLDDLFLRLETQEIKWIDYCSGKGVALKQGTERFNTRLDKGSNKIVSSLGVDIRKIPNQDQSYIDTPEFLTSQTRFYQHDIENGILPLQAHFISCIKGLLYTFDPVNSIEKMYNQLNPGGCMLVTVNTENEVEQIDLTTYLVEKLNGLNVKNSAIMHNSEFVLFIEKEINALPELNFNLELYCGFRDDITGWTKNLYHQN